MNRFPFKLSIISVLALALAGCSESPAPAKKADESKKAVQPVSGQSAAFRMFQVLRTWAPDAELLKLENGDIPEAKAQPGKYGHWRATFVSPSKGVQRECSYAVADSDGGVIEGVRPGAESPYQPSKQMQSMPIGDVKIDTPAALEAAMKAVEADPTMKKALAGEKEQPVQYLLEWTEPNGKPTWRVIFGLSLAQSKFSVLIDATSGKYVKKLG